MSTSSNIISETIDENTESEEIIDDTIDNNVQEEKDIIVPNDERITIPRLTKYERVRLLGDRAKQISDAAKSMIVSDISKSAMDIAIHELNARVIPLKILRTRPDGKTEIWNIKELDF